MQKQRERNSGKLLPQLDWGFPSTFSVTESWGNLVCNLSFKRRQKPVHPNCEAQQKSLRKKSNDTEAHYNLVSNHLSKPLYCRAVPLQLLMTNSAAPIICTGLYVFSFLNNIWRNSIQICLFFSFFFFAIFNLRECRFVALLNTTSSSFFFTNNWIVIAGTEKIAGVEVYSMHSYTQRWTRHEHKTESAPTNYSFLLRWECSFIQEKVL